MLFGDLHIAGCCPFIEGLIIGHMVDFEDGLDSWHVKEGPKSWRLPIQQFCFVREMQRDSRGGRVSVAVPVSRAMLRKTVSCTDVLDLDMATGCMESWRCWAGHAIA